MGNRPGDMLAGRYRLDDLMSETGQGRFWRGYDTVLARTVAIHVLNSRDERAPLLLAAARASAQIVEARLLRVLDVASNPDITYVVNEWGKGKSLDDLLAAEGPLPPRRAAWIADEVSQALITAHERDVAHGMLNPENVLVDTAGAVRLIGFAVEAALHGLGTDRISVDVIDLAGILQFGLTGRWAGASESATPAAPTEHDRPGRGSPHGAERAALGAKPAKPAVSGATPIPSSDADPTASPADSGTADVWAPGQARWERVLRPRQIRAGVPRVLDDLCDEVINRPHGRHAGPNTAREIHERLTSYVGDPAGLAEELASDRPAQAAIGQVTTTPAPELADTQAGAPIFEDSGEVRWFSPRKLRPTPAPPPEPIPERPLFADQPRRAKRSMAQAPFEAPAGTEEDETGHRWLRVALVAVTLVVLIAGGLVAWELLTRTDGDSGTQPRGSTSASLEPATEPTRIESVSGLDFDPLDDPPTEYRDIASRAVDGDPETSWRTSSYNQQLGPPANYKAGLGYVVDLGASYAVDSVEVTFGAAGTTVQFYVLPEAPTDTPVAMGLSPVAEVTAGTHETVSASGTGRYVLLWFTALPPTSSGKFRTELAEVSLSGTPA